MSVIRNNLNAQKGISLLEVLISLVIVSTSMLAIALYALMGLQENQTGYVRSQASLIAYDMADRIRANASYALAANNNYSITTNIPAEIPAAVNCATAAVGCSQQNLAAQDLREWTENFTDVAGVGVDGANYEALIPDAIGEIDVDGQDVVITITWNDSNWDTTGGDRKSVV